MSSRAAKNARREAFLRGVSGGSTPREKHLKPGEKPKTPDPARGFVMDHGYGVSRSYSTPDEQGWEYEDKRTTKKYPKERIRSRTVRKRNGKFVD